MNKFFFFVASAYGAGAYGCGQYNSATNSCVTATGGSTSGVTGASNGITGASSGSSLLANTGFDVLLAVSLAAFIVFVALMVRFWKRPAGNS